MKKIRLAGKSALELLKSSRVRIQMNTSQKVIRPDKGKGSYSRKVKHNNSEERQ